MISFQAWEDIAISIINFDFAGFTVKEAKALVVGGDFKFVMRGGGCLSLVPVTYQIQNYEYDLIILDLEKFQFKYKEKL